MKKTSKTPGTQAGRAPRTTLVDIEDLKPDPNNRRLHGDRNREVIGTSLKRFGAARSVVLDKANVVRAGSGTLEEARAQGFRRVLVVESDGRTLVAVRRSDWRPGEATQYALADNRSAELAEWDRPALARELKALRGADVAGLGWTPEELESLKAALPGNVKIDEVSFTAKQHECPKCGHVF